MITIKLFSMMHNVFIYFIFFFSSSSSSFSPVKLREELDVLEEAKRENMEHFISQLRRELEGMWDKCYVGDQQKETFAPFVSGEWKAL